jgi:hypothetical protein
MLNLRGLIAANLARSGHWPNVGQFSEGDRIAESLEAQLRVRLNVIPADAQVRSSI